MKTYDAEYLRNVVLVGHQGTGKTVLAEAMLYESGALERMGTISDGSTVSDYHTDEQAREMTIFSSLINVEWKGHKLNVIDTPGYPDFVGEVVAAMKVCDTAAFMMNAADGVQVGTELAWTYGEITQKPSLFIINHLDREEANFRSLVDEVKERFGRGATVVQLPGGTGSRSIIDVLRMEQVHYPKDGTPEVQPIAAPFQEEAQALHQALVEDIAENDEALMEQFFDQGTLTEEQMRQGLHDAMIRRELFPIFVASTAENIGVSRLMSFFTKICPSPASTPPAATLAGAPVSCDPSAEPVALVYRTMAEEHVGNLSFLRVYAGVLEAGQDLENAQTGATERLGPLHVVNGQDRRKVARLSAGDLGAVVKLRSTGTNHTLRAKDHDVIIEPIEFPEARYRRAVRVATNGDEDKLARGLNQIQAEDPSLTVEHDPHLNQIVLGGQGKMHLAVVQDRLRRRAGVEVVFDEPRVAYRETVQDRARASYRHKKQTGGAGQFADISLLVEPLTPTFRPPADIRVRNEATVTTDWGATVHFVDAIVGGVIDMRRFFGAIQKGILENATVGPLLGYPLGDMRVVIYDGGMHDVDSNENAFKTAARHCFREAFMQARPALLEPIMDLEVTVRPDDVGEVMSDLSTRRARVQGIEADGLFQTVKALVPEAELHEYATTLRSKTQGRGLHVARFSGYEVMPPHVKEALIEAAGATLQEA